jgi:hypothetical protein
VGSADESSYREGIICVCFFCAGVIYVVNMLLALQMGTVMIYDKYKVWPGTTILHVYTRMCVHQQPSRLYVTTNNVVMRVGVACRCRQYMYASVGYPELQAELT